DGGVTWDDLLTERPFYPQNICSVPSTDHTLVSCGWGDNATGSSFSITDGEGWFPIDSGISLTGVVFLDHAHGWSGRIVAADSSGGIFNFTGYFFATGVEEPGVLNSTLQMSPNPAADQFTVLLSQVDEDANEIFVSDISGRVIFKKEIDHSN